MGEHYFTPGPDVPNRPGHVDLLLADLHLRLETVPAPPATGSLLDLGCGYGPIALTMARRSPQAIVYGVDVNRRALAVAGRNATTARLDNVKFCLPDEVDPAIRFAALWSNPPIRIGKAPLHELLGTWLGRLAPGGGAHLVVHRHLGADSLHRWLTAAGWPAERIASRSGYRVLAVTAAPGRRPA